MGSTDVVDQLAGVELNSPIDGIRKARPQTRDNLQASYEALFTPAEEGPVSLKERFALAAFAAGLHGASEERAFYERGLVNAGADRVVVDAVATAAAGAVASGPKGSYRQGPLSREDDEPPTYRATEAAEQTLGRRLASAFAHTHMLVYHPRDASREALDALLASGWTTSGIVTISQLVAFLSFQLRVIAGLRALAA